MKRIIIAAAIFAGLSPVAALSLPVSIDYNTITPSFTEDFEGRTTGLKSDPFDLGPVSYSSDRPFVLNDEFFCGATGTCLQDQGGDRTRSFTDFDSPTTAFGLRVRKLSEDDMISATVTGGSGESVFTITSGLNAFMDTAGITSISFFNAGDGQGSFGNFSFDDIALGTVAPVPLPPAGVLLLGALGMLAFWRKGVTS